MLRYIRHIVSFVALLAIVFLNSCSGEGGAFEEQSAFGVYADSLDWQLMLRNINTLADADTSRLKSDRTVNKHYVAIKNADDFKPLWFTDMGIASDADEVIETIREGALRNGLDTAAFMVGQIKADLAVAHELSFDSLDININDLLPRLEYNLTKSFVRYVAGMRHGFVRPDQVLNHLYLNADSAYAHLFDYELAGYKYSTCLQDIESGDRLEKLREAEPTSDSYRALQGMLHGDIDRAQRRRIAVNLERMRWNIKHPDANERRVIVNIPAQQLWAIGSDTIIDMRVCYGAKATKTPLLSSMISYLQVNPEWSVPRSIIRKDMVRHAGDASWFARHGYYILDSRGDTLNPATITEDQMARARVIQRGGKGNSLGRIVFRFANNFSVYLHDTNSRWAFDNDMRALSHGCVRVQKPFELACFLLPDADEWLLDKMRLSMDLPPETEQGMEYLEEHPDAKRPLRLVTTEAIRPKVPVYILYYTVYPNPVTGAVETWHDVYGYDTPIREAMHPFVK
jgi:hypothetical protein